MVNYSRFYEGKTEDLATVVAFDPGETTGFCVMGIKPSALAGDNMRNNGESWATQFINHIEYGEINCITGNINGFEAQAHNHAGIALEQERFGVTEMIDMFDRFPKAAIVFEDFIIDMNQITAERSALSPVRITAAFSYGMDLAGFNNPMFIQNRSLAKTTCTDLRLKHWGLYDSHSGAHARDATRHAYYFLRDCRGSEIKAQEKRWRAWPHLFEDPATFQQERLSQFTGPRKKKTGERVKFV